MIRKIPILTALLLLWPLTLWAQSRDFQVIGVDSSRWPELHLTATLPEGEKSPLNYSLMLGPDGESTPAARIEGPLKSDLSSLVLAVDTSHSLTPAHLEAAKEALGAYVDRLEAGEQLALLAFNDNVQLASGFTSDRDIFKNNLGGLTLGGTKTELYRSLLYGVEILKNLPGRHHLLVLSDGHDEGSGISRDQVIQRAQEYNVRISAIGIPGTAAASGSRHLDNLRALAAQTRGVYQEADSPAGLQAGLNKLLDQQRAVARLEQGRIYDLSFDMGGLPPRMAVNADLLHSGHDGLKRANFFLPPPPADMVALASDSSFWLSRSEPYKPESRGLNVGQYIAELTEAEALAASRGNWPSLAADLETASAAPAGTASGQAAAPELAVSASADSDSAISPAGVAAPAVRPGLVWQKPLFWLLLALALGIYSYYYWRHWQCRNREAVRREAAYRREGYDPARENEPAPGPESSPYSLEFPETGQRVPLPRGVISVGSSPNNHIVVEELTVSPRHMEIYVSGEGLSIRNLNELNRTIINGDSVSIDRTPLKPGDKLIIGRTIAFIRRTASGLFSAGPKTANG